MKKALYTLGTMFCLGLSGSLLAEGEDVLPPPDQSFVQTLIMIGIAFLFFYVILWRPEQKRKKAMEDQRSGLKKGDKVVAMGIIGTVVKTEEHTVILKMYDGESKIEVYKAAITDILSEVAPSNKKVELISEEESSNV